MKQIVIALILLVLLVAPVVAQDDDECTGASCEENATGILCEATMMPIWFGVVAFALRRR